LTEAAENIDKKSVVCDKKLIVLENELKDIQQEEELDKVLLNQHCSDLMEEGIASTSAADLMKEGIGSTSAAAASEGRTGVTFDQPPSDDHIGEAGLLATSQQTHHVDHFGIGLVVGVLLCPRRPRQSELASRHGRRICCLDHQQHLGSCPSPHCLQLRHRQMVLQAKIQLRRLFRTVQDTLSPLWLHPVTPR
jgi:hypothetical protein